MRSSQKPRAAHSSATADTEGGLGLFFPRTSTAQRKGERDTLGSSLGCKVQ